MRGEAFARRYRVFEQTLIFFCRQDNHRRLAATRYLLRRARKGRINNRAEAVLCILNRPHDPAFI